MLWSCCGHAVVMPRVAEAGVASVLAPCHISLCRCQLRCGCSGSTYEPNALSGTNYEVIEVGLLAPEPNPTGELLTGQVRTDVLR